MALWDRMRSELDRAGRMAQGAFGEGRERLEAFRARQQADAAAQVIGYAVYRARLEGKELEPENYDRMAASLAAHEARAQGHEAALALLIAKRAESRRS